MGSGNLPYVCIAVTTQAMMPVKPIVPARQPIQKAWDLRFPSIAKCSGMSAIQASTSRSHRRHAPGHDAGEANRAGQAADPQSLGSSLSFDREMQRYERNPGQHVEIEFGKAEGKKEPADTGKQQPMRARGAGEDHRSYRNENREGMQPIHIVRKWVDFMVQKRYSISQQ